MGQVTVIVNGRSYRLRCGEGEEQRLTDLAENVRQRIDDLSYEFGHAGDERLLLMAAIMVTDELWDTKARLAAAEARLAAGGHDIAEDADVGIPTPDDAVTVKSGGAPAVDREVVSARHEPSDKAGNGPTLDTASAAATVPPPADAPFVQEPSLKRALRRGPTPAKSSLDDRLAGARDGTPPLARGKISTT